MTSTKQEADRGKRAATRPRRRRRAIAAVWAGLGLAAAVWLHAPARMLDAASAAGSGVLQIAGLESGPAAGPRAAPVADALERPDFTLRLNPQYSRIAADGTATLRLQTTAIVGFTGRSSLRATVKAPSGLLAGGVIVGLPRTLRIGATTSVTVWTRAAPAGRYVLTLTATSGGVTHVASALISVH